MASIPLPSIELLRQLVDYSAETGALVWRERSPSMFPDSPGRSAMARASTFNRSFAGRPAFSCTARHGHLHGTLSLDDTERRYFAHRIAFAVFHGRWPEGVIDHINGNPADNRIENLRDTGPAMNARNARKPSTNTSGHVGIYQNQTRTRWRAHIMVDQKPYHLGSYLTLAEAVAARKAAEMMCGFTRRHGS